MSKLLEHFMIFLRGLFMGTADIIPGVSGGTIALITGIYERLVKAISSVNKLFVKELAKLNFKNFFKNFKKFDFQLIIPLFLGIMIAFLSLAHLMDFLLINYTALTYAFFFGLILSSAIFVYKQSGKHKSRNFIFILAGFLFAFWIAGMQSLQANHSLPIIFFSGVLAICAMILPGISGAFILVLLNQYEYIISVIKNFEISKISVFGLGAIIGLLSFSKLLEYLLKKHKGSTMSFLAGLMLGSLRLPFTKVVSSQGSLFLIILLVLTGFFTVFFLERKFSN